MTSSVTRHYFRKSDMHMRRVAGRQPREGNDAAGRSTHGFHRRYINNEIVLLKWRRKICIQIYFLSYDTKQITEHWQRARRVQKKNRKYLTSDFSRTDVCHFQSGGQWLLRLRIVRTGGQYLLVMQVGDWEFNDSRRESVKHWRFVISVQHLCQFSLICYVPL